MGLRVGRLVVVPAVFLAFGATGAVLGAYYSFKAGRARSEIERAQELDRRRKEILKELKDLEAQIEEIQTRWDVDRWVPAFEGELEAGIFALEHLGGLLEASGAKEVEVMEAPRPLSPRGGQQSEAPRDEVRLQAKATFGRWGAVIGFLRRVEEGPPLLLVESVECKKEGREVALTIMVRFPFRRADGG